MTHAEQLERQQSPAEKDRGAEDLSRNVWDSIQKDRSGSNGHNPEKGYGGGAEGSLPNCTIEHERSKETTCDDKGQCTTKETEKDKITCDLPGSDVELDAPEPMTEAEQLPGPAEDGEICPDDEPSLDPINPSPDGSMNRPERIDQVPEAKSQEAH